MAFRFCSDFRLVTLSLVALVAFTACGPTVDTNEPTGKTPPAPAPEGPSTEAHLPNGTWVGPLAGKCTLSGTKMSELTLHIENDIALTDFSDGMTAGTALDEFQYTAIGVADWMGLQGKPIGICDAQDNVFHCKSFPDQVVQEERTWTFSTTTLQWSAIITFEGDTCTYEGELVKQ